MIHVSIAPGYKAIVLPNGRVYAEGEEADLTDAEFASIPPSIIGTIVLVAPGDELDNIPIDADAVKVTGSVSIPGTVTVSDGGGSITVDGTVSVTEPVSVDDNGGSLTVDDGGFTLSIDDGGGIITVDGTVTIDDSTPVDVNITSGGAQPQPSTIIVTRVFDAFPVATAQRITSTSARRVLILWENSALASASRPTVNGIPLFQQSSQGGASIVIGDLNCDGTLPAITIRTNLGTDDLTVVEEL
jgi:hypothetical protein